MHPKRQDPRGGRAPAAPPSRITPREAAGAMKVAPSNDPPTVTERDSSALQQPPIIRHPMIDQGGEWTTVATECDQSILLQVPKLFRDGFAAPPKQAIHTVLIAGIGARLIKKATFAGNHLAMISAFM
jgi:hypothetical protein